MVHVPLMFLSKWRKFPSVPCLVRGEGVELDDSSGLDVVEIAHASPDMLPFSLCNKKRLRHINRPLFPMTLSILSYDIKK
jgi:hypothetical protein